MTVKASPIKKKEEEVVEEVIEPNASELNTEEPKELEEPKAEEQPTTMNPSEPSEQPPTTTTTTTTAETTFDPKSTSWKTRKSSFEALNSHLKSSFSTSTPASLTSLTISSKTIDLDSSISTYLADSNAAALDAALTLALTYSKISKAVADSKTETVTSIAKVR